MFVFTFKWNKKVALLIIAIAVLILCAVIFSIASGGKSAGEGSGTAVKTNADRVKYLENRGWHVAENPVEEKNVVIPKEFSKVYETYNKLQLEQGFDLSKYGGLEATIYTYTVENYSGYAGNVVADLYVLNYRVIGGDVHSLAVDGFMHGLSKR